MKAFVNGIIVTPHKLIKRGALITSEDKIVEVLDGDAGKFSILGGAEIIDAQGLYISPGFVDIHCHGGGEKIFFEDPEEVRLHHLEGGTTSICASLGYNLSREDLLSHTRTLLRACKKPGTSIAGIHFEGPFINPKFGANSHLTRPVNEEEYNELYELARGFIRQWMISPEIEGAEEFADFILSKGIPLAIGHTNASPEIIYKFIDKGATIATHLFDAMGCHLGNETVEITGIIQDTACDAIIAMGDRLYCEIICDSMAIHVKPANLKLAYRCIGPDRIVLITDCVALRSSGSQSPGISISDLNFNERGQLSGSRLTMEAAVKNMKRYTGATISELVKMASENPAKAVGIYDRVGSLEPGKKANIVMFDQDLNIKRIYLNGNLEFEK